MEHILQVMVTLAIPVVHLSLIQVEQNYISVPQYLQHDMEESEEVGSAIIM